MFIGMHIRDILKYYKVAVVFKAKTVESQKINIEVGSTI